MAPQAPAKPCSNPYCMNLRPCPDHPERKPFESRTPRTRYGTSGWAWQRTVARIIRRDGGRCRVGLPGCTLAAETADHIIGRRAGGTDDDHNLRAACRSCNEERRKQQALEGRRTAAWR